MAQNWPRGSQVAVKKQQHRNRIQERALRIIYNYYESNFKELLEQDHSFTIHKQNLQYLLLNLKNGLSPVIMNMEIISPRYDQCFSIWQKFYL